MALWILRSAAGRIFSRASLTLDGQGRCLSFLLLDQTLAVALHQRSVLGLSQRVCACSFHKGLNHILLTTQHNERGILLKSKGTSFTVGHAPPLPCTEIQRWYQKQNETPRISAHTPAENELSDILPQKSRKLKLSEVRQLLALAKPERITLTYAVMLLALSSSVTMAVPLAFGHVVDIIYTTDPVTMKQNLYRVCLLLVPVFVLGALANFGRVYLMSIAGQRITRTLRAMVFSSVMQQEVAFFDQNKTGELVNRLSADTALVSETLTMNISDGLRSMVMVTAGIAMMFWISAELAIVGLSIVPPVALMAVSYGRYIRRITRKVQDQLAEATHVAEEKIANIRTVKAFACESREMNNYRVSIENVLQLTYRESLARGVFFGLTGLSGNLIILSVLYYGGTLVTEATLSVGLLSSFLMYAAYVGIALGGLSSFYSELNRGLGASTRIFNLINRVPAIPTSGGRFIPLEELMSHITFDKVTFAYPSRPEVNVFKNLSLSVPAGSVVAVVGSSGSGKSTLGSLLLRLYDVTSGAICIDGISVTQLDPSWLHTIVASVSQEPVLFSSTIRENILYGSKNPSEVTKTELYDAAREANAFGFIESLPSKMDTLVGERGVMLSGGQKQRVAIARALLANPRILLLDEATSALDSESEHLVQEALERLMWGRTVITIAHRLSTIRKADRIAVLNNGAVAELGTYDELMASPQGIFRKLVEHQLVKQ